MKCPLLMFESLENMHGTKSLWKCLYKVIRTSKSKKDRHCNCQRKETKGETMIYKTLNRKIEQHEFRKQPEVNLGATGR